MSYRGQYDNSNLGRAVRLLQDCSVQQEQDPGRFLPRGMLDTGSHETHEGDEGHPISAGTVGVVVREVFYPGADSYHVQFLNRGRLVLGSAALGSTWKWES